MHMAELNEQSLVPTKQNTQVTYDGTELEMTWELEIKKLEGCRKMQF
jgi:hypothetical protein